ncbi:hypothetical protein NBO_135g0003 [Nosema bombycis CQ1]|uniref:Uncharacterized protein n=1 Tax=Nosema bombycis (strain CQ1 / CVCC 102059) TaxID=578461 RepID=R0KSJ2_NOSB1|nr:hypothetical protein NBO_135g0003 [Nosema bombycis CQ1]|eukprot:EOB13187.1 hypothetical protein NBO_135g0003 [Nosema bombycis CQ1]
MHEALGARSIEANFQVEVFAGQAFAGGHRRRWNGIRGTMVFDGMHDSSIERQEANGRPCQ